MSNEDTRLRSVVASVPMNVTAAKVMARGIHYTPEREFPRDLRENRPEIVPIPPNSLHTCADLPGKKFGRFIVVGLAREQNKNKNARWVCKCSCGRYEFRKAKAIRGIAESGIDDCCSECENLKIIKKRYDRMGSKSPEQFR